LASAGGHCSRTLDEHGRLATTLPPHAFATATASALVDKAAAAPAGESAGGGKAEKEAVCRSGPRGSSSSGGEDSGGPALGRSPLRHQADGGVLEVSVPGPMPAAVASRCFRRRFQQLVCACGS